MSLNAVGTQLPSSVVETEQEFDITSEPRSDKVVNDSILTLKSYILSDTDYCKPSVYDSEEEPTKPAIKVPKSVEDYIEDSVPDDCGEPFREQYLKIDFTPTDSPDDDDYNMQKCIEFWQFLNSHKELRHLKVTPKINFEGSEQTDAWSSTNSKQEDTESTKSVIKWMKRTDLMKPAFYTKQESPLCDDHKECDWLESEKTITVEGGKAETTPELKPVKKRKSKESPKSSTIQLQSLIAEMKAWDPQHPKSFDPPSHPPALNTAQPIRQGRYYWDLDMGGAKVDI